MCKESPHPNPSPQGEGLSDSSRWRRAFGRFRFPLPLGEGEGEGSLCRRFRKVAHWLCTADILYALLFCLSDDRAVTWSVTH